MGFYLNLYLVCSLLTLGIGALSTQPRGLLVFAVALHNQVLQYYSVSSNYSDYISLGFFSLEAFSLGSRG